jgi:DNA-directed RNA polymerase specialized sigma24 family protein
VHKYLERRLGPGNEQLISQTLNATFEVALRAPALRPYARRIASTPMRLWLLRLANRHLARMKVKAANAGPASSELTGFREAMNVLPVRHQAVLALALFEGLPVEELAAALGVGQGRAMRMLRSALRHVGEKLQAGGEKA